MELKQFKNFHLYNGKSLMAVDFGSKAIGLATFIPGRDPYPLGYATIVVSSWHKAALELANTIAQEQVEVVIFGLPLLADGEEGQMARKVKGFARAMAQVSSTSTSTSTSILFQDEYLSSYEAKERMRATAQYGRKANPASIHQESAKIILEDFIRADGQSKGQ